MSGILVIEQKQQQQPRKNYLPLGRVSVCALAFRKVKERARWRKRKKKEKRQFINYIRFHASIHRQIFCCL